MAEPYSLEVARTFWDVYFTDDAVRKSSEILRLNRPLDQLTAANHRYIPYRCAYIENHVDWKGTRVLEFGCGQGNASLWMAEQGALVTATDIVPSNVELTRRSLDGYPNRCVCLNTYADLDSLGEFDLIFSYGCLHHIPPPFIEEAMAHLRPRLAPGGVFWVMLYAWSYISTTGCDIEGPFTRGYTLDDAQELLGPDLQIVMVEYVNVASYMYVVAKRIMDCESPQCH
jgi:SAM-dependent methyltransferase